MNAIAEKARLAGLVGAGGAGFPTHVKLSTPAEIYLVNGAECEPLLKVDQQLATKYAELLVRGLELAMQAVGAREGIIALKSKYTEAIATITPRLKAGMRIHILKDVYPAGDEVITIWMATGRRVPPAGLPKDVGVAVNNVLTLINLARAVNEEAPVITRTLTVNGAVAQPVTITVPLGISLREALALAGGTTLPAAAYIDGGPMMGKLVTSLDAPVTKNLSVNNIDVQLHFSEHNNGCGQMIEGEKAAIKFLESHEQLTESIEPTVRDLDNPAPGSLLGITLQFKGFLSSSFDMWDVAMLFKSFQGRSAGISSVGTQVLAPPLRRLDTLDHHGFQHGAKLRDVMPVSPGHDE